MPYQLIILGQSKGLYETELVEELKSQFAVIGLDPENEFQALRISDEAAIDWHGVPVTIWFGAKSTPAPEEVRLAARLVAENLPILPVVEDLKAFNESVPQEIQRINGQKWDCQRIVTDILRELRLTRKQRQVFVSYKRTDSLEVAGQLFDRLTRRGFRVFWDTASVDSGADFQQTLWARMADVSLGKGPPDANSRDLLRESMRYRELFRSLLDIYE